MAVVTVLMSIADEQIRDALLSIVTTLKLVLLTVCTFELCESCLEIVEEPLGISVLGLLDLRLQFLDVLFEVMNSNSVGGQSGLDHTLESPPEQPTCWGLLGILGPALPN